MFTKKTLAGEALAITREADLDRKRSNTKEGETFEHNGLVSRERGWFYEIELATRIGKFFVRTEGIHLEGTTITGAESADEINAFRMTVLDLERPDQSRAILVLDPRRFIANIVHQTALDHAHEEVQTALMLINKINASALLEDISLMDAPGL